MSFESFQDFIAMGGHGLYVWLAYGAAFTGLAVNLFNLGRAHRRALRAAALDHAHAR